MVSSPKPEFNRLSPADLAEIPQTLCVFVEDPDAHYKAAVAAGARVIRELKTEEYGARGYEVLDPENHAWFFSDYRPGAYWED